MDQDTVLFGLSVDAIAKNHLKETASRAEFPAIAGMVICVLMAIGGFVFSFYMSQQLPH